VIPREGVETAAEELLREMAGVVIPREGVETSSQLGLETEPKKVVSDPERGS
jgi:hypothetical protein